MNKNLKLKATLQFAHLAVSASINTMIMNRSLWIQSVVAKFLAASASNNNDTTAARTKIMNFKNLELFINWISLSSYQYFEMCLMPYINLFI